MFARCEVVLVGVNVRGSGEDEGMLSGSQNLGSSLSRCRG